MKKIIFIFALTVFLSLAFKLTLNAQNYRQEADSGAYSKLEAKIDVLSGDLKSSNKEILRKIDLLLSNQEKIFAELAIIKVRASKR